MQADNTTPFTFTLADGKVAELKRTNAYFAHAADYPEGDDRRIAIEHVVHVVALVELLEEVEEAEGGDDDIFPVTYDGREFYDTDDVYDAMRETPMYVEYRRTWASYEETTGEGAPDEVLVTLASGGPHVAIYWNTLLNTRAVTMRANRTQDIGFPTCTAESYVRTFLDIVFGDVG